MTTPTPRRLLLVAALMAAAGLAHAQALLDQPAPGFSARTADGKSLDLAGFKGKTVVLEWTNHDCPYVKKHYGSGNIPGLQKDAAAKGVVWLQVISSAPGEQGYVEGAQAIELNGKRGAAPANTLLDPSGQLGKLYGAQTTPHIYIVNAEGQLVYKGGIDSIATSKVEDLARAEPYVKLALAEVAAGRKPNPANTRPYGCSVKYAKG